MKSVAILGAVAVGLLAGCSSGGSSGPGEQEQAEELIAFEELFEASRQNIPNASDLPEDGTARYVGSILVASRDDPVADTVVGELALDVDFGGNSISGTAGSFVNQDGDRVAGALETTGGIETEGQAGGDASVSGQLEFSSGVYAINTSAEHYFTGDEANYHVGVVDSTEAAGISGDQIDVSILWATEQQ